MLSIIGIFQLPPSNVLLAHANSFTYFLMKLYVKISIKILMEFELILHRKLLDSHEMCLLAVCVSQQSTHMLCSTYLQLSTYSTFCREY